MKLVSSTVYSKALAIFVITSLILWGLVAALVESLMLGEFSQREQTDMRSMLSRALLILDREKIPLQTLVEDWSQRPDVYAYAEGSLPEFTDQNFGPQALEVAQVDFIAIYDRDGRLLHQVHRGPLADQIFIVSSFFTRQMMLAGVPLIRPLQSPLSGFALIEENLLQIAAAPIRTTAQGSSAVGTIIAGSFLKNQPWDFLQSLFGGKVEFQNLGGLTLTESEKTEFVELLATNEFLVRPINDQTLGGFLLLRSINETPVGVVRIEQSRSLFQDGLRASRFFLIAVTLVGAAMVAILWILLDRTILARIRDLTRRLETEKSARRLPVSLDFKGNDELGTLAKSIEDLARNLEAAQAQYRSAVEEQTDSICRFDAKNRAIFANRSFKKLFGKNETPLEDFRLLDIFTPEGAKTIEAEIARLRPDTPHKTLVHEAILPDRRTVWLRSTFRKIFDMNENLLNLQWVATDVSAQVLAERRVLASEQSLRKLSSRLLRLQDEERRRIARELHDSTAQNLSAIEMNISLLKPLSEGGDEKVRRILEETRLIAEASSNEIRNLSYLLHPPLLDEVGLSFAIKWFADGFSQRTNIAITVDTPEHLPRLGEHLETPLFRVVQEALSNVYRHSAATEVTIHLEITSLHVLRLRIRDNGKGFPKAVAGDAESDQITRLFGVGLAGMHERLAPLKGKMRIDSSSQGTELLIEVPLPDNPPPDV